MRSNVLVCLLTITVCVVSIFSFSCAPNAGKDGSAGSAGADGDQGIPGAAGQDGSDGSGSAPQSPSSLTAEAQSPSLIDVRWVFNTGSELGFNVQRSETEGEWETIAGTAANVTVYHDESVECEHTYIYRVLAYNDYGESAPSNEEEATADFCELDAPTDLTAILEYESDDGAQRPILLSWSQGAGQLPGVPASYEIYRKTFDGSWSGTPLATQPSDQTTYTDEDAACGDTFQYRVRAANENDVKSAFSNTTTSRADACPLIDPSNITATTDLAGSIEITWDINDPDATGYLLQRREYEARDEWTTIVDLPEGSTSYSDDGAECETAEHDYRLRAYNGDKQSAWIETLTPGSSYCVVDAPTGLFANAVGPDEIELSWINIADNATGIRIYRNEAELTTLAPDATMYSDTTVDCQSLYRYTVTAFTANVESNFSNTAPAQSDWCPIMAPYNVTTVGDGNEVTVSWEHDQQYVESFDVQRRNESEGTWQLLETVASPDTNVTDTTVECYRNYEYRVLAYNSNVESEWSETANGAATGCMPERPRPSLSMSEPLTYVAFSQEDIEPTPDPLYPLTIYGEGIAADSMIEIGDFVLPCDTDGQGADCRADESGNPEDGTCATSCVVSLPNDIVRYADTYVVRLNTPDPVWQGQNQSAENSILNVLSPVPESLDIWPRGITQRVDINGNPITQEITVNVRGKKILTNATYYLKGNYGTVIEPGVVTDPVTLEQSVNIRISTEGIEPHSTPTSFTVTNPSPGGGSTSTLFGVNPWSEGWTETYFGALRPTRASQNRPMIAQTIKTPQGLIRPALQWNGESDWLATRDDFGKLLTRFPSVAVPASAPVPAYEAVSLEFQDKFAQGSLTYTNNFSKNLYRGGDGTFGGITTFAESGPKFCLGSCDINNDAILDIFYVEESFLNELTHFYYHLGNGDMTFDSQIHLDVGLAEDGVCKDINSDGRNEFIVLTVDGNITIQLFNSNGTLGTSKTFVPFYKLKRLALSDMDGDGFVDIIATVKGQDLVVVYWGRSGLIFDQVTELYAGNSPRDLSISDFNNDGIPDIVTVSSYDYIVINMGMGSRQYLAHQTIDVGDYPKDVAVADLNMDGAQDIVTANFNSDDISILMGFGDGTFASKTDYNTGGAPRKMAITDISSDGFPDILTANYNGDNVTRFINDGLGGFTTSSFAMGNGPREIIAADFNNDGITDLAVGNLISDDITIREGDSGGIYWIRKNLEMGQNASNVALGDVNNDGDLDIAACANHGDNDNVSICLGTTTTTFVSPCTFYDHDHPLGIVLADLNNDNDLDLVTVTNGFISRRLGNGNGTFAGKVDYSIETVDDLHSNIKSGDINNDGKTDIVTSGNMYACPTTALFFGNGNGTFGTSTILNKGGYFDLGDLNDDGADDIVQTTESGIAVRMNNGSGGFPSSVDFSMNAGNSPVILGDLNTDGDLDVATVFEGTESVIIRMGNGDGTFGPMKTLHGIGAYSIAVGDIDGDGNQDISTNNQFEDITSIYLGNGDGTFRTHVDLAVNEFESSKGVWLGDFNKDNTLDIISADANNSTDDRIRVAFYGSIKHDWRQELTDSLSDDPDQPWLSKFAVTGLATEVGFQQYHQDVYDIGVRVFLEWMTQPSGTVSLGMTAPDGQTVDLGDFTDIDFTPWPTAGDPTSWRLSKIFREYDFQGVPGYPDLADLKVWQPTGDWKLTIVNSSGADAEVKDFTVLTYGHF